MNAHPDDRWTRHMMPNYGAPELTLSHGQAVHVWDASGKRYLDFLAGLAVTSTGHAHPRVVEAVQQQATRLFHVSNLYATDENLRLAQRLARLTGLERAFFCNSGAEANEFAIKLARRHGTRRKHTRKGVIIALENGFHGRTLATVTLTGQPKYHADFDPLPGGFRYVPANDEDALARAFEDPHVIGMFVEFVQGEGGVKPLTSSYARAVRDHCTESNALLIADEIQTGIGRTGKFLAQERYGVKADATTLAKGLASGLPIGACMVDEAHKDLLAPGDHGCTFGGNPLASAAALATLDVIEEEGLVDRAADLGGLLRVMLADRVPGIAEVRGLGLLNAIEFEEPIAKAVRANAQDLGLLVGGLGEHAIRLAPPLVITEQDVARAVDVLEKAAATALAHAP